MHKIFDSSEEKNPNRKKTESDKAISRFKSMIWLSFALLRVNLKMLKIENLLLDLIKNERLSLHELRSQFSSLSYSMNTIRVELFNETLKLTVHTSDLRKEYILRSLFYNPENELDLNGVRADCKMQILLSVNSILDSIFFDTNGYYSCYIPEYLINFSSIVDEYLDGLDPGEFKKKIKKLILATLEADSPRHTDEPELKKLDLLVDDMNDQFIDFVIKLNAILDI